MNPYAPPRAAVADIVDPRATGVPADRGTRLGAALLDGVIFTAMVYAPIVLAGMMVVISGRDGADSLFAIGAALAFVSFVVWCWITIRHMRNGQSIAKKMMGIKVVRSDGSPVSLGRLLWLRNVLNWVINIVPLYGLLDSLFIFGESRQCLHDKLADTIVVKA